MPPRVTEDVATQGDAAKAPQKGKKYQNFMKQHLWYLDGIAYDFEPFVARHPGGKYAICLGKGRECKALFMSYHLKLPPQELLDKYRCPESEQLSDRERQMYAPARKFTFDEDGFYMTVKREALKFFKEKNKDWKADWTHSFQHFITVGLMLYSLAQMIAVPSLTAMSWMWALLYGLMRAVVVVQLVHAASHHSISRNPSINRWWYRIGTILITLWSPGNWDLQHVVAHHIYTNEWPYDSDSGFPIKSIAVNQRRLWYHKYQHIYLWFVYALFVPIIMLNALREIIAGKQMTFKMIWHWPGAKWETYGCITGMYLFLLTPFYFLPWGTALPLFLISNLMSSLWFSLQFVVNHETDAIFTNAKGNPGHAESIDWGAYQCMESASFAPDSRFALETSGGLNTQIEHHLFPSVHYGWYKDLSPIVRRVAKRFNVPYIATPTVLGAWKGHYRLLKNPPKSHK